MGLPNLRRPFCSRERLYSYEEQIDDLRKQRYILLKKNSELKDANEELSRSADHMKKNNADLRKQIEGLRDKVEELTTSLDKEKSRSKRARSDSKTGKNERQKDETKEKPKAEAAASTTTTSAPASATPEAPLPTDATVEALSRQIEQQALKIGELESSTTELLNKNLALVRKNMELIQRLKESESNSLNHQRALQEANLVCPSSIRLRLLHHHHERMQANDLLRQKCESLQRALYGSEQKVDQASLPSGVDLNEPDPTHIKGEPADESGMDLDTATKPQ